MRCFSLCVIAKKKKKKHVVVIPGLRFLGFVVCFGITVIQ